jgi:hypothetical protein
MRACSVRMPKPAEAAVNQRKRPRTSINTTEMAGVVEPTRRANSSSVKATKLSVAEASGGRHGCLAREETGEERCKFPDYALRL